MCYGITKAYNSHMHAIASLYTNILLVCFPGQSGMQQILLELELTQDQELAEWAENYQQSTMWRVTGSQYILEQTCLWLVSVIDQLATPFKH